MSNQAPFFCRSCGAKVQWAKTEKGKRMPVDWQPNEKGNILLVHRPLAEPLAVYQTKEMLDDLESHGGLQRYRLYLSHFVTCPQRNHWRKKR